MAAANGANTTAVFSGIDPRTGKQYVYLETLGGGFGGRATKDGSDGVQVHITNTSNLPVEAIETEYPLFVRVLFLVEDSGGAGQHRGGMGLRRVIGPVGHVQLSTAPASGSATSPGACSAAEPGGSGRFVCHRKGAKPKRLADKPSDIDLAEGDTVAIQTPGAGGYGRSTKRSATALERDRASGKFSTRFLKAHYGKKGGG